MNDISRKLRQEGYRLTNQRQQILGALTVFPQSATEVFSSLKKKGATVDKVTVYRTLDFFVGLKIVGKTQFKDKKARYELLSVNGHHHHLICNNCGAVGDIPLNEGYLLKSISQQTDFKIESHTLEFFGICGKCQ